MSQDNSHEFDVAALYQLSSRIEEIYSMLTRDAHLRIIEQSPILESIVGNNKEQWVTLKGASEYTSLSIAKLRRAVACGELRVSKRGGRLLFKVYWLDLWLTS